jgi:hypothetical protein
MKLFVCSDIHGFFDEFKKALDEAGFEGRQVGEVTEDGEYKISFWTYLRKVFN